MFRYFIKSGRSIWVNGKPIDPVDPLMVSKIQKLGKAQLFGNAIRFPIRVPGKERVVSDVEVRFSLLPVEQWHDLSDVEKREMGILNGASISVVRAFREIYCGWIFMGAKRRENYDNWWRCEVRFQPELDELFGVTHTKQQIRPAPVLNDILSKEMEAIARRLNGIVRRTHEKLAKAKPQVDEQRRIERLDQRLPSLPLKGSSPYSTSDGGRCQLRRFDLQIKDLTGRSFYETSSRSNSPMISLNQFHPFYREVFMPLTSGSNFDKQFAMRQLRRTLLALARADIALTKKGYGEIIKKHRESWSDALFAYLGR